MSDEKSVLVLTQNMFFLPRVQNAANAFGYEVIQARTEPDFWDKFQDGNPILVLVDLEGDGETWPNVINGLKSERGSDVKVVAYGPHEDEAALARARELGCNQVLTKGEFSRDLHKILESP